MGPATLFAIFVGFMVVIGGITVAAMLLPRPSRSCPRCTRRVLLTAARCRNCGYRFAPEARDRYVR
jgi:predicted amidophosphoribosyltransferase